MKNLTLLISFIWLANTAFSQENAIENTAAYFVLEYTTGENWDTTKQFYEQAYFQEHSKHLSNLRKLGNMPLGGRYSDKGLLILKAKDQEEAEKLVNSDPSIQNKTFKVEIHFYDVFYTGCLE